jgi:hypothetical protein
MNNVKKIIKSKITIFIIQILILTLLIYLFGHSFSVNFDASASLEQRIIIQVLANYIMFDELINLMFIYILWISVALIPIFIFIDYRKAYSMNLTTFFFPNFFFYVFLSRHSPIYYSANFPFLFPRTLILGIVLVFISFGLTFVIKKIQKSEKIVSDENLKLIQHETKYTCSKCGTEFSSLPKYCYNCLNEIIKEESIND